MPCRTGHSVACAWRHYHIWLQAWGSWGYLWCGVTTATPLWLYPLLFPGDADRGKPIRERYWLKAQIWLAVFGFIGNYFWTHYFFKLLGADYTMPSHRLNNVRASPVHGQRGDTTGAHGQTAPPNLCMHELGCPERMLVAPLAGLRMGTPMWEHSLAVAKTSHACGGVAALWQILSVLISINHDKLGSCVQIPLVMFMLTHAYFCLYHALSNVVIRRTLSFARGRGAASPWAYAAAAIFVLAYVTAVMETLTIMHVRICHCFPCLCMWQSVAAASGVLFCVFTV